MSDKKKLLNEISKMTKWAIESSNDNFSVFFDHVAHCGYVEFTLYKDGWKEDSPSGRKFEISTTEKVYPYRHALGIAKDAFKEMKGLKVKNGIEYTEENIEKRKKARRVAEIGRLEAIIKGLRSLTDE